MIDEQDLVKKAESVIHDFGKGNIQKYPFLDKMKQFYQILNLTSTQLKKSPINRIEILSDGLIFHFKDKIKLFSRKFESLGVPSHILNLGIYEEEEKIIYNMISDGDVIFDIGANIGWYSINFSKRFKNSKIFSFEPMPETFDCLSLNVKINKIDKNLNLNNIGFSDINGMSSIYFPQDESALASMENIFGNNIKKSDAEFTTMDDFVKSKNIDKIDFIKCDVEGAELKVIQGGYHTIKRFLPILLLEIYEEWTNKFLYSPEQIIKFLYELGYGCFLLKEGKFCKISNYSNKAKYCNEENNNFFFLHSWKHENVIRKFYVDN